MMDERETDELLSGLFKRSAPSVDEPALRERLGAKLLRKRRAIRKKRTVRAVALGFASVALVVGVVLGAHVAVDRLHNDVALVFTDLTPTPADSGWGTGTSSRLAHVSPVMGTAVLERVKSEGTSDPSSEEDGTHWVRGRVEVYRLSMSQPAINGTMEITSDLSTGPGGSTEVQGSWVLRTSQGRWEGSFWTGIVSADGTDQFYMGMAAGSGGFEGLLLILEWHVENGSESAPRGEGPSWPISLSGWIQAEK